MKKMIFFQLLAITLSMSIFIVSCSDEMDYSKITYRNYLWFEISRSQTFLLTTVEGTKEGQYLAGSKQAYQNVIDEVKMVYPDLETNQQSIDNAYEKLLKAGEDFFDKMVPFKINFQKLIDNAEVTLAHTQEGELEGNAKTGSKQALQSVVNMAKQTISRSDLTQRMIDQQTTNVLNSIYTFDKTIIGKSDVFVENFSFESPGYATEDFSLATGWKLFGKVEDWAPAEEIFQGGSLVLPAKSVPDGKFVAKIGSYTHGIYQPLAERIHPNVNYMLNFKAAILSNDKDGLGKKYKVIIQSRILVFNQEVGDYMFAQVIKESIDTLGLDPKGFVEINQSVDIGATSVLAGKTVVIDFITRHTFEEGKQIWAESYVAIDKVKLYRKQL